MKSFLKGGCQYCKNMKRDFKQVKPSPNPQTQTAAWAKEPYFIAAIFLVSLLIRLIYLFQIKNNPFFVPFEQSLDPYIYDKWAQEIAKDNWLGSDVFFGMPLYAYFLGIIYAIFGHNILAAVITQMILGSATIVLTYKIAKITFNHIVAVISSLLAICYNLFIFYEGFLLSTPLEIFLFSLLIFSLLKTKEKLTILGWLAIGIICGLASLARASALLFIPFVIIWNFLTFKEKPLKSIIAYMLCFLLTTFIIIGAVIVRNYAVSKDIIFITAHSGINFYIGNNEDADGTFKPPKHMVSLAEGLFEDARIIAERDSGRILKPSEISKFWYSKSYEFIKSRPLKYLGLLLTKTFLFFNGSEVYDVMNYDFFKRFSPILRFPSFTFSIICPLALVGIFLSFRHREKALLLYFFLLSYVISIVLFFVNSRYRMPTVPVFLIFASYALFWTFEKIRASQWKHLLLPAIALIFLAIVCNVKMVYQDLAVSYNNLALVYKGKGLYNKAIEEFKEALKINPGIAEIYFNLGNIYYEQGDFDSAIDALKKATAISPDVAFFHRKLGFAYANRGILRQAKEEWRKALEIDPDQIDLKQNIDKITSMGY